MCCCLALVLCFSILLTQSETAFLDLAYFLVTLLPSLSYLKKKITSSPHYSSSSPLNTFPFRLIKFHRVGRGSEEGGSTHMSNRSCYFSGVALSWAAKHPPAKSSHCKTNVVASLVGDIKNGNTSQHKRC